METLHSIKADLVRTADHLDGLRQAMNGHVRFMQARGSAQEHLDVNAHIASISHVVDELRTLAAKLEAADALPDSA
ncbi:hypothetical protein [Pseudomonas parafulva]|uniref:hypothetical protein n=1 Tax=Pseudomonas parafulva TaxID=157782 RepID=UPI00048DD7F2|nr:hypothetical protein [Pseudomonas parafulva]